MTELDCVRRCAVCATDVGPFERHHIALRVNHDTATVWLCPACHDEQTDRQHQAGLITRKPSERGDELRSLHALTEGLTGILTAHALRAGQRQLVAPGQQSRRATLRLIARISDERSGPLGARPISNDRRRARRLREAQRSSAPSVPDSLQALAGLFPALVAAATAPLPGSVELLPGFTAEELRGLLAPSGARRLARNLAALETHPRAAELAVIVERDWASGYTAVAELAAVDPGDASAQARARLTDTMRNFYTLAGHWIRLLSVLAASSRPADVHAALERFLDQRAGKAGNARKLAT